MIMELNGNANNPIKQIDWTVPAGTQAMLGGISFSFGCAKGIPTGKPKAMTFYVPNGTFGINDLVSMSRKGKATYQSTALSTIK